MSSALLKKSLLLCESNDNKVKKAAKLKTRVTKVNKSNVIQSNKKVTVTEARELLKDRERILKNNLQMLKEAKRACAVQLNKEVQDQIVERATARRNRKPKEVIETKEETLFTEEDFKKFEAEFIVE